MPRPALAARPRLVGRDASQQRQLDLSEPRWDRSGVSGSGFRDDAPAPRRGAVPPPPSLAPGDAPAIEVPRMEPPPASLEAMVQRAQGKAGAGRSVSPWLWVVLLVGAAVIAGYVMK
jgi:hypothetical protein